jgi:hypothetical protein
MTAKPVLTALKRARYRLDAVADWRVANELGPVEKVA